MSEQETSYNSLMATGAAATAASGGALALYNGDIAGGAELASQGKDLVEPVFYDPENKGSSASDMKDHAVGNIDTAVHFLQGAGLSGLANKVLNPSTRAKGLAAGVASGAIGYSMLKEGMVEGAFETLDLGYESIKTASDPVEYTAEELGSVDYTADQSRDLKADTAGVGAERALYTHPNTAGADVLDEEIPDIDEDELSDIDSGSSSGSGLGDLLDDQPNPWSPNASLTSYNSKGATAI